MYTVDVASFSAMVLVQLLLGIVVASPDNFMVSLTEKTHQLSFTGMHLDSLCAQHLFSTDADAAGAAGTPDSPSSSACRHVLFLSPLMQSSVHTEITHRILSDPSYIPVLITSWIRELYIQNTRYDALLSAGFSIEDMQQLHLPIHLPQQCVKTIYGRLQVILGMLTQHSGVTHDALFQCLYPHLHATYSIHRHHHQHEQQEAMRDGSMWRAWAHAWHHAQQQHSTLRGLSLPTPSYTQSLEDAALALSYLLDYSTLLDAHSIVYIYDSLSFLPTLFMRCVTEEQLIWIFGSYVFPALSSDAYKEIVHTEQLVLIGCTPQQQASLVSSVMICSIQDVLKMLVLFVDEQEDRALAAL